MTPPARQRVLKHRIVRDLLAMAADMASREPRRPKQTSLRRAVSSAYYAVFHAICYVPADALIGWRQPWDQFARLYRSLDHHDVKQRFDSPDLRALGRDVRQVGDTLRDLMRERHTADYDPRPFTRTRAQVLALIALAEEAVEVIEALDPATYRGLAVLLLAKPRRL